MVRDLNRKIGDKEFDGLITDLNPPAQVGAGTLAAQSSPTALKRGTLLGRNASNNTLAVFGSSAGLVAHSVLCDDCEVGSAQSSQAVYTAGCFHTGKITVAENYTLTEGDLDNFRMRNIVFKLPHQER